MQAKPVGEVIFGGMRPAPKERGVTTFTVSGTWWAAGKAGELATALGEVGAAYAQDAQRLDVEEAVLIKERDALGAEYNLWHAAERVRLQSVDHEGVSWEAGAARELVDGRLEKIMTEGRGVEGARLDLIYYRQQVVRRGTSLRVMSAVLAEVMTCG